MSEINVFRAKCNVCYWIMEWHQDFEFIAANARHHSLYYRNHDVSLMTELQKGKKDDKRN